jgi:dephospho-CoA kinase
VQAAAPVTLRVGLTGGIGSGKSTVADMLAARGAVVVDADEIAREVVVPGGPAYDAVVARFGSAIVSPDGTLDRSALAEIVFGDPEALADLNAITHPVIGAVMLQRISSVDTDERDADPVGAGVTVAVIPLLKRSHVEALALRAVVVVDCPTDVAVRRLVESRGMDERDARARAAAQPPREERLALATYVVDNGSTSDHLAAEVELLWEWLTGTGLAELATE